MSRRSRRSVTFFLSPRIVDLDSYLPVAMALKAARPEWRIRFVTFERQNIETIARNPTLRRALEQCAEVVYGGAQGSRGLGRQLRRLRAFWHVVGPIVTGSRPVLIAARPFSVFPYDLMAALARLRGGLALIMCKNRSPNAVHELMFTFRDLPPQQHGSRLARMAGTRDGDALVHYHDAQDDLLREIARFGRLGDAPRLAIGMPHQLPEWRAFIAEEVARAEAEMAADPTAGEGPVYGVFAAKPGSGQNLGLPGAVERSFVALMQALSRLTPNATILVRAHPKAMEADYIRRWTEGENPRVRMTCLHPEVLIALSDRCFANNPTNVFFHGFGGRLIDVSEYPPEHTDRHGAVSLAHGLGPLYADPRSDGFESDIARLVEDDTVFEAGEHDRDIPALFARNPADINPLLALIEEGGPQPAPTSRSTEDVPIENGKRSQSHE